MADLLIRDVPEDVVAAIDVAASRLQLSRSEYLRRKLARELVTGGGPVTVHELARFTDTFSDLADPEVMRQAWR